MEEGDKLPENAALSTKNQERFQKFVSKKKKQHGGKEPPGVVYVGHIPRGFREKQMRHYFEQFGTVKKIRLARSVKTGGYKGYGYIKFKSATVAKVVADTMNNYLMFHKLLKCEFLPPDSVHKETFKGWNKRFRHGLARENNKRKQNRPKTRDQQKRNFTKFWRHTNKTVAELKSMGIHYEFTNFVNLIPEKEKKEDSDTGIGSDASSSNVASISTSVKSKSELIGQKHKKTQKSVATQKVRRAAQIEAKKGKAPKRKATAQVQNVNVNKQNKQKRKMKDFTSKTKRPRRT